MHHSPDHSLPQGMNPADLLRQGMRPDTIGDNARHPFHAPSLEELAPLFPELDLIELIGEGGMGAVYKARQCALDRLIALKILPEEIGGDTAFSEQFTREAKALAKLNHPNIVSIHEFGLRKELHYIIMEYVDGTNLRTVMEHGLINPKEALAIVPPICDALQYAHDRGIVHRDIKPENILLSREGTVKVADFGLAKLVPGQQTGSPGTSHEPSPPLETILTRDGKIMGTPAYMAPEQLETPSEVDHRADIYALGVVFYQMRTGKLPEGGISAPDRKPSSDSSLNKIVMKAMAHDPGKRYQQASVMKTGVETLHPAQPASNQPKIRKWLLLAGLLEIMAGGIAGIMIHAIYAPPLLLSGATFITAAFFIRHRWVAARHGRRKLIALLILTFGILAIAAGTITRTAYQRNRPATPAATEPRQKTQPPDHSQTSKNAPEFQFGQTMQARKQNLTGRNYATQNAMIDTVSPARTWLERIDAGQYETSYGQLADSVKKTATPEKWTRTLADSRKTLGKVLKRTWNQSRFLTTLPDMPDGEYMLVSFETTFEHREKATETITLAKHPNGTAWQIIGYDIR